MVQKLFEKAKQHAMANSMGPPNLALMMVADSDAINVEQRETDLF